MPIRRSAYKSKSPECPPKSRGTSGPRRRRRARPRAASAEERSPAARPAGRRDQGREPAAGPGAGSGASGRRRGGATASPTSAGISQSLLQIGHAVVVIDEGPARLPDELGRRAGDRADRTRSRGPATERQVVSNASARIAMPRAEGRSLRRPRRAKHDLPLIQKLRQELVKRGHVHVIREARGQPSVIAPRSKITETLTRKRAARLTWPAEHHLGAGWPHRLEPDPQVKA